MLRNSIFVIGQHRTGSTLIKNILNAHSEVTMAFDEMNLYEPFRKNTLDKILKRDVTTPNELINHIKEKKIYGTFWKDFDNSGITLDELEQDLIEKDILTTQSIMNVVLDLLKKKNNSYNSGIKYPIHFRKTNFLMNQFPNSKIIFLTRNPLAIIASKLNDPASKRRKQQSILKKLFTHYITLFYFSIEYIFSIKTYIKHKDNLLLILYEELILRKEYVVSNICEFCCIEFEESMLNVSGKSSSYKLSAKKILHRSSLEKYKEVLHPFDIKLISFLTQKYYKKIQNELSTNL